MKKVLNSFPVLTALILLLVVAQSGYSQTVPFKAKGSGNRFTPGTSRYEGPGNATHMGLHWNAGKVDANIDPNTGYGTWVTATDHVMTAADGSQILLRGGGDIQMIPLLDGTGRWTAVWQARFVVVGGTRRFRRVGPAAQPLSVIAVNDPFFPTDPVWTFSWEITGQIRKK